MSEFFTPKDWRCSHGFLRGEQCDVCAKIKGMEGEIERLTVELGKRCNCEFEGPEYTMTKQCTLHNAWAHTLHEQAEFRRERDAALVDAKRYHKLAAYIVSDNYDFDDAIVASETVEEISSVVDAMKGSS